MQSQQFWKYKTLLQFECQSTYVLREQYTSSTQDFEKLLDQRDKQLARVTDAHTEVSIVMLTTQQSALECH